jgi:uncharacterized repeat protein (TIGR01451 family)
MYPIRKEEDALESLEHELYDPKRKMDDVKMHALNNKKTTDLPTSWGETSPIITEAKEEKGVSFGVKLLLFSTLILFCAVGFVAWRILSLRNVVSTENIDMSADISPYVEGGESTPLSFTLHNRNTAELSDAVLTLMYKQGNGSQDEEEKVYEKRPLGVIKAGEYKLQDFKVTLYGKELESRDISMKLEYKIAGSNAVFSKLITTSVSLKAPPISVHIDGPDTLSVGQTGIFTITVKNNSSTTSLPTVLQVTLPNSFTTQTIDPPSASRGTAWLIAPLKTGDTKVITITGQIGGNQGEVATLRAAIGSVGQSATDIGVVYAYQTTDVKLRTSPLTLGVSIDTFSAQVDSLRYGDRATLNIPYSNSGASPLSDVAITLSIAGDAAIISQIDPGLGYLDSNTNTITWNKATLPALATLSPNQQGSLQIVIPIVQKGTNSPALKIALTGSASLKGEDDVVTKITKQWSVKGSAAITAKTSYTSSPFTNSGPIPPVANTPTTYDAHLVVSAQNALVNTAVSFTLPVYVTWRNVTAGDGTVTYTPKTRTVTWNIDALSAGKTVTADIGLSVKPSLSHVGQLPPITSGIVLEADEEVSRNHIHTTLSPITTYLTGEKWPGDPSHVIGQ